jgi:hypothetical protein
MRSELIVKKKQWLSPREVDEEYGISRQRLAFSRCNHSNPERNQYKLPIPAYRVGKSIKYYRPDIESYLAGNRVLIGEPSNN